MGGKNVQGPLKRGVPKGAWRGRGRGREQKETTLLRGGWVGGWGGGPDTPLGFPRSFFCRFLFVCGVVQLSFLFGMDEQKGIE